MESPSPDLDLCSIMAHLLLTAGGGEGDILYKVLGDELMRRPKKTKWRKRKKRKKKTTTTTKKGGGGGGEEAGTAKTTPSGSK